MQAVDSKIKHPRRSYILLLLANMSWIFGVYLYSNFIGLFMREELGANSVQVGYWSTVFILSMLLFIGLGGILTARLGEKQAMILGWIVIIPAPLIYLFAMNWQMVLVGAFLEGASMLAAAPIGSYITSLSGGGQRGRAFGGSAASIALGGIPSPVIGGLIITLFSYSLVFLISFILFIVSTIMVLPISPIPTTRKERAAQRSWKFFKNRVFIFVTLFWFSISTLFWIANMFVPLFLYDRWGLTEAQIGALGSISNASGSVLGPVMGWIGDRWSYVGALIFPVIGILGFYGILMINPLPTLLPLLYVIYGFIHCFSLVLAVLSHNIPRGQLPDALAAYNLIGRSLSPISPIIGGLTFAISPGFPLLIASVLMPIPLVILFFLRRAQLHEKKITTQKEETMPAPFEEIHPGI
ncbi:MAG: MFS transporter [Promethearchaeota archaeon]